MKYKIIINGYGAHIHVRRVSKEIHDFWSNYNSVAVCSHLFEDSYSDINGNPITSDKDPLFLGMAKSKRDRMLEVCGPRPSHIHVHVFDEDDNSVSTSSIEDNVRFDFNCNQLSPGCYLKGIRECKGTFFTGFVHTEGAFDLNQLKLPLVNVDNDKLLLRVEYGNTAIESEYEDTGIVKETYVFTEIKG